VPLAVIDDAIGHILRDPGELSQFFCSRVQVQMRGAGFRRHNCLDESDNGRRSQKSPAFSEAEQRRRLFGCLGGNGIAALDCFSDLSLAFRCRQPRILFHFFYRLRQV
jgi:hypothetical protein